MITNTDRETELERQLQEAEGLKEKMEQQIKRTNELLKRLADEILKITIKL